MFRSNLIEFLEWIIAILNICSIGILIVGIVLVLFKLLIGLMSRKTMQNVILVMQIQENC